jgi:hypothetical protein
VAYVGTSLVGAAVVAGMSRLPRHFGKTVTISFTVLVIVLVFLYLVAVTVAVLVLPHCGVVVGISLGSMVVMVVVLGRGLVEGITGGEDVHCLREYGGD